MVISGALRGAGKTHVVLAASILGGWCVRLPLAYFGGVAGALGISAVWMTMLLDWVVRSAFVSWRFARLQLGEVKL
jgi:Na+-driven multidrug efflux pump